MRGENYEGPHLYLNLQNLAANNLDGKGPDFQAPTGTCLFISVLVADMLLQAEQSLRYKSVAAEAWLTDGAERC